MNRFKKKKTIVGCTQTVSENILEQMNIVHEKNKRISFQELVKFVAYSTFTEDTFARCKDWQAMLEMLVFRSVQSRLAADGHLEWVHDKLGWTLLTKTYIDYLSSSGFPF